MKTSLKSSVLALASVFCLQPSTLLQAATTIDPANHYAYGANVGWLDWRGDVNHGAVIGEYVCSGSLYAANLGWISLGSGAPANQIQYQNNAAGDFGVNHDGLGKLTGYAYSANVGWINFEQIYGKPRVDLYTGKMSGNVWSANCGWISLSNAIAFVQTTSIQPAPLAPNGLPVAWLLQNYGTINVSAAADSDGDGASNADEYQAGTNPNDANSVLRITSITRQAAPSTYTILNWNSVPTRFYAVQYRTDLAVGIWQDWFSLPFAGLNNVGFNVIFDQDFFRIRAFRPLMP